MKTKPKSRSWPRDNEQNTKQDGLPLNSERRSDFPPLLGALCVLSFQIALADRGAKPPASAHRGPRPRSAFVIVSRFAAVTALILLAGMAACCGQTNPTTIVAPSDRTEQEYQFRKELDRQKKLHPEAHQGVATALNNLAVSLRDQGKTAEAENLFRETLAIQRKLHGPDHFEITESLCDVAAMLEQQGKLAEAEGMYREAVMMLKKLPAVDYAVLLDDMHGLGKALFDQGKFGEAETLYREILTDLRKVPMVLLKAIGLQFWANSRTHS